MLHAIAMGQIKIADILHIRVEDETRIIRTQMARDSYPLKTSLQGKCQDQVTYRHPLAVIVEIENAH